MGNIPPWVPKDNDPFIGTFWFETLQTASFDDSNWLYCIGSGENTPVALVAGPDDYVACARARVICKALNDEARKARDAERGDT